MEYSNLPATFLYSPVSNSRNRGSYTTNTYFKAMGRDIPYASPYRDPTGTDLHVKPLLRCIEVELEALISHRFGPFNPEQTVADLKLNTAIHDVQSQAPMLWRLLCGMVEQRASHDVRTVDSAPLMMICAVLTYTRAPRKSTFYLD